MTSESYLDIPTSDGDVNRLSEETLNIRPHHLRTPSPSPRRRKPISTHRGDAGFGSSVINLANTILGLFPLSYDFPGHAYIRCGNFRYENGRRDES